MSRLLLLSLILSVAVIHSNGQLSYGGTPIGLSGEKLTVTHPPSVEMPSFDVETVRAAHDLMMNDKVGPWYYGHNFSADISTTNSGVWEVLPNGSHVWRVAIKSKGAYGLNFEFHEFEIPEGGQVFVYTPDMKHILGAYDTRNRVEADGHGMLAVQSLPGEKIIIEYVEPVDKLGLGVLKIGQVTHAYRDIWGWMKGLGDSGSCNINVVCPLGAPYEDDISAVAIITTGGNGFCTGTVINNCAQDSTPYFLTADHCINGPVTGWIFRFHWQSPDCVANLNGPTNYTVSGATLHVNDPGTDVALVEMASMIPDTFNVAYAGWDKSGAIPDSTYGIHHPSGDIKKICFDRQSPTQVVWGAPPADCWQVAAWDDGTTEQGSSGSGLWNQDGRLIGQLFGGSASCTSNTDDNYGRFDVSWPLLEPFLGMCGDTLDRLSSTSGGGGGQVFSLDAGASSIQELELIICNDSIIEPKVTIKNDGNDVIDSVRVEYRVDNGPITSEQFVMSISALQTANFFLTPIVVGPGSHTLQVFTSLPNGQPDMNPLNDTASIDFITYLPAIDVQFDIILDAFGTETTWELHDDNGVLLHEGGPYGNGNTGAIQQNLWCLGDGCYTLTMHDSFGDGICCDNGYGWYHVFDSLGTQYVYGNGGFTSMIQHTFCLTAVGIEEHRGNDISLYPNPTNGILNIRSSLNGQDPLLSIYDLRGALARSERMIGSSHNTDVSSLHQGVYILEIQTSTSRVITRFVKQ